MFHFVSLKRIVDFYLNLSFLVKVYIFEALKNEYEKVVEASAGVHLYPMGEAFTALYFHSIVFSMGFNRCYFWNCLLSS